MAILKHYTLDPKTQKYCWKISLIPGIGIGPSASSSSSESSESPSHECLSGSGVFAGYDSKTTIDINSTTDDYKVFIVPTSSNGDIGEYWVEDKTKDSFVVKNTGANKTSSFDWFLISSEAIIHGENKEIESTTATSSTSSSSGTVSSGSTPTSSPMIPGAVVTDDKGKKYKWGIENGVAYIEEV